MTPDAVPEETPPSDPKPAPAAAPPDPSQPPPPSVAPEWWPKGATWPPEWDDVYDYDTPPPRTVPTGDKPKEDPLPDPGVLFSDVFSRVFKWVMGVPPEMRMGLDLVRRALQNILGIKGEWEPKKEDCAIILERGDEEVVEIRHKATTLHDLAAKAQRVVAALDDPPPFADCFGTWTCPPTTGTYGNGIHVGVRASPYPDGDPPPGSDPYGPDAPSPAVPGAPEHPLP